MTAKPMRLGEILAARGYVTEKQVTGLLMHCQASGKLIGEALVEKGYISREVLEDALNEQQRARERS